MKKHIYRVSGATKKGGYQVWAIDIEADTAKEAKEHALKLWGDNPRAHMFQLIAERRDDKELEYNFWKHIEADALMKSRYMGEGKRFT